MVKYLFIIINSLAVFLYSLFSGDGGITVTSNIPSTIKAGQEVPIELKINKGSMAGFAKLQLELPEGMAVKETENKGANYTYNAGIAKWVWASLPGDNEVSIKLTLISSVEASGVKTVRAKFSYVEDNAKQVVEMTPAEVTITAEETMVAAETTAPVTTENPETGASSDSTAKSNTAITSQNIVTSNSEPPGNINVVRTVTKVGDNDHTVNLRIKKGNTKGFARYSDALPEGVTVKSSKTDGSSFSIGDGKLKFVWVNVPEKEELELEYNISSTMPAQVNMNGEYSYLEDNQSKKYSLTASSINLAGNSPIADVPNETKIEVSTTPPEESTSSKQTKMEETLAKKDGSVNYHVQIGAFTNAKVAADRLKKKFNINESVSSEMQGGFSKFMVGSHAEYKGARDHREIMKSTNGIKSAFVVAYNGPARITVQEALMITSQKWFK